MEDLRLQATFVDGQWHYREDMEAFRYHYPMAITFEEFDEKYLGPLVRQKFPWAFEDEAE